MVNKPRRGTRFIRRNQRDDEGPRRYRGFCADPINETMSDDIAESNDDSRAKVAEIFRELVGERVSRLTGSHYNHDSAAVIARALSPCPEDRSAPADCTARDIAFHLTDWASDAAFIVAVQLFPERFSPAEIADGVEAFLCHAPNHIAAAAVLSGEPVEDIFDVKPTNSKATGNAEADAAES
jgi:hypothetical protein